MADGSMSLVRRFHIRDYAVYYREDNPKKCLLFDFNNEGAQAPEDTQAIEGVQAPEDIQAMEGVQAPEDTQAMEAVQAPEDTQALEDTELPETSEEKRKRKGKAAVVYKDPTDSESEDLKGYETGDDIDKDIELQTSAEYVVISDSETATDSEPEVPNGNETHFETHEEIDEPMDLDYDTSRTISDGHSELELSYCPNEDSDNESDDISSSLLRKRKAGLNKKKRKPLKTKKPRFDIAEKPNSEIDASHAELLVHFVETLNLDDEERLVARRKGSGSSSRPGCSKPSGSDSVMDATGGAKNQQAPKAKLPVRLVMTKELSRIVEVLKLESAKKKSPKAPLLSEGDSVPAQNKGSVAGRAHGVEIRKARKAKAPQLDVGGPSRRGPKDDRIPTHKFVKLRRLSDLRQAGTRIGSGVCGGVDGCEPSGSEHGANGVGLALALAKPVDHEVLNCTLNMNPAEFCAERARDFTRTI